MFITTRILLFFIFSLWLFTAFTFICIGGIIEILSHGNNYDKDRVTILSISAIIFGIADLICIFSLIALIKSDSIQTIAIESVIYDRSYTNQ